MPRVWPSCATHLLSCLEQSSLDVVPDILWPHQLHLQMCSHASWRPPGNDCLSEGLSASKLWDEGWTCAWILVAHQSSCRIQEADVAELLPHQGSLLHLWQVCAWSYKKRMNFICVAMFPDLYVMRWLSRLFKHVFPRSRSNARAYSRILSPSTSGSGLPYPIPPCTSLYPMPAQPTWLFQSPHWIRNSDAGILAVTARSWSKKRSLTSSLTPLCGAYTDRKVITHWLTMSFTKMILPETLWASKTFSIHSSATNTPTPVVPLSFPV